MRIYLAVTPRTPGHLRGKTGWHNGVYVLPDEVIGPDGDNVILGAATT
ncbi:hypothetical protein ECZU06_50480 [Escherichia coli]|nr:hypothetical protein ECZU06_50480 [Escherichia coli]